ncbi:MAG TPA: HAMP domain-containing sensor histidine kinase [Chitinophagales bacterium]|nr:HAMP domain-containing sensor histidine kinase [Chitinophagales bacterium]
MFKKFFSLGPFKTFYFVFAYIIAFSVWWAYLLYAKNEAAFQEKIELNRINFIKTSEVSRYEDSKTYQDVVAKYHRQQFMIVTEGAVFILLLLIGLLRVRKVFFREMELAAQQRNFLLSITHELKSPLSTIKLSLQTMTKRKLEPAQSEKLIGNSLVDLDRLETLVDNILFAAKIEREEPGLASEEINVSEIVRSVSDRFSQNKKAIPVLVDVKKDIYMNTDAVGFTSVVINLLENAIKYSGEDATVNVELTEDSANVFLSVTDTGIGISDEDKKKVFDKFYRVGNEDTRKTKGTGLGLYIVKRMVELGKGVITISDNQPRGTAFNLRFPKMK